MSFGEYFKNLRKEKSKTQGEIAKAINKSTMLISGVESGKNGPFVQEDLVRICEYLNLTDEEREKLFIEASVERGNVPESIAAYMKEFRMAFRLINVLKRKNYTDEDISELISNLEEK